MPDISISVSLTNNVTDNLKAISKELDKFKEGIAKLPTTQKFGKDFAETAKSINTVGLNLNNLKITLENVRQVTNQAVSAMQEGYGVAAVNNILKVIAETKKLAEVQAFIDSGGKTRAERRKEESEAIKAELAKQKELTKSLADFQIEQQKRVSNETTILFRELVDKERQTAETRKSIIKSLNDFEIGVERAETQAAINLYNERLQVIKNNAEVEIRTEQFLTEQAKRLFNDRLKEAKELASQRAAQVKLTAEIEKEQAKIRADIIIEQERRISAVVNANMAKQKQDRQELLVVARALINQEADQRQLALQRIAQNEERLRNVQKGLVEKQASEQRAVNAFRELDERNTANAIQRILIEDRNRRNAITNEIRRREQEQIDDFQRRFIEVEKLRNAIIAERLQRETDATARSINNARRRADAEREAARNSAAAARDLSRRFIFAFNNIRRGIFFVDRAFARFLSGLRSLSSSVISSVSSNFQQLGQFVLTNTKDFEKFRLQLAALNSNAVQTAQEFKFIRKFAAESPLSTKDIIESFVTLKAVGTNEVEKTVRILGNVASVFNKELSDVTSSFISLEARTLRGLGVVVDRETKNAILKSGNVVKVVNNDVESIRRALLEIFKERIPNALGILQNSLKGQFDIIGGLVEDLAGEIGSETIRKPLLDILKEISGFLESNRTQIVTLFSTLFNDFDRTFAVIANKINKAFGKLFTNKQFTTNVAEVFQSAISTLISGIQLALIIFAEGLKQVFFQVFNKRNFDQAISGSVRNAEDIKLDIKSLQSGREFTVGEAASVLGQPRQDLKRLELIEEYEKELADLNKTEAENIRNLAKRLSTSAEVIRKESGLVFDEVTKNASKVPEALKGIFNTILETYNETAAQISSNPLFDEDIIRRATQQLKEFSITGNITAEVDLENLEEAIPLIQKKIRDSINQLEIPADLIGANALDTILKYENAIRRIEDLAPLVKNAATLTVLKEKIEGLNKTLVELDKIKALEDLLNVADLAGFDTKIKQTDITLQQFKESIAKGLGENLLKGKSLGAKILDQTLLKDQDFMTKFINIIVGNTDPAKILLTKIDFQRSFAQALQKSEPLAISAAEKLRATTFNQFANFGSEILNTINKSSGGSIAKIFDNLAKKYIETADGARAYIDTIKSGGFQLFIKQNENLNEVLKQTNPLFEAYQKKFTSFGKDLDFVNKKSGGGIVTKEFFNALKESAKAEATVINGIFDEIRFEEIFREKLKNLNKEIPIIFGQMSASTFIGLELIENAIRKMNLPKLYKDNLIDVLKGKTIEDIRTNLTQIKAEYDESNEGIEKSFNDLAKRLGISASRIPELMKRFSEFNAEEIIKNFKQIEKFANLDKTNKSLEDTIRLTTKFGDELSKSARSADISKQIINDLRTQAQIKFDTAKADAATVGAEFNLTLAEFYNDLLESAEARKESRDRILSSNDEIEKSFREVAAKLGISTNRIAFLMRRFPELTNAEEVIKNFKQIEEFANLDKTNASLEESIRLTTKFGDQLRVDANRSFEFAASIANRSSEIAAKVIADLKQQAQVKFDAAKAEAANIGKLFNLTLADFYSEILKNAENRKETTERILNSAEEVNKSIDTLIEETGIGPQRIRQFLERNPQIDAEELLNQQQQIKDFANKQGVTLAEPFEGLNLQTQELQKNISEFSLTSQESLMTVANTIGDGFTNAFMAVLEGTKTAEQAFKEMAKAIISDLIRIFIRTLAVNAVLLILNALTGNGAAVVGFGLNLLAGGTGASLGGAAKGGILKGHKYAAGGVANSPQVGIFGEGSRAEAFVPLPDNRNIPVKFNDKKKKKEAPNVIVNFNLSAIDGASAASFLAGNQRVITQLVMDGIEKSASNRTRIRGA